MSKENGPQAPPPRHPKAHIYLACGTVEYECTACRSTWWQDPGHEGDQCPACLRPNVSRLLTRTGPP